MTHVPGSALEVANEYLGIALAGPESIARLSESRLKPKGFASLFNNWVANFTLPSLRGREMRPLILNSYNNHTVLVPLVEAYDPIDVYRSGDPPLAEAFERRQYSPDPFGSADRAGYGLLNILANVKRHCLYSDSVALELPFTAGNGWSSRSILEFLRICAEFAPLANAGVVHFTPSRPIGPPAASPERGRYPSTSPGRLAVPRPQQPADRLRAVRPVLADGIAQRS